MLYYELLVFRFIRENFERLSAPEVLAVAEFVYSKVLERTKSPILSPPPSPGQEEREKKELSALMDEEWREMDQKWTTEHREKVKAKKQQAKAPNKKNKNVKINEKFDHKLDWYVPRLPLSKTFILTILYIIRDLLISNPNKEPTKTEIQQQQARYGEVCPSFIEPLEDKDFEDIRKITKAMWRKFKVDFKAQNLSKFESYVRLSKELWRKHFEEE